jgi:nicotinate-nucleotide adenylyltransferase
MAVRSVALLGGTFDPIHLAHLRVAEEVREACGVDEVRLVPAAVPPHKMRTPLASAADRLRMVELATEGVTALRAWDIELTRSGPSYSIDTVRALRAELGPAARIVFALGRDAFADFHSWRDPDGILALADLIVLTRPPVTGPLTLEDFPVATRGGLCYDPSSGSFRHASGHEVRLLPVTPLEISATDIRTRAARGRSIRFLVPEPVARYIAEQGLYRASGELS